MNIDYSDSCDYLSDDIVKKFRNKLECFRHSTKEDLETRENFTQEQKQFLINFGLLIIDFLKTKVRL